MISSNTDIKVLHLYTLSIRKMSVSQQLNTVINAFLDTPNATLIEPTTYCNFTIVDGRLKTSRPSDKAGNFFDHLHDSYPRELLLDLIVNQGWKINAERSSSNCSFRFPQISKLHVTFSHPERAIVSIVYIL